MTLPLPNEEETVRFQALYREKTGTELSRQEAYEALSQFAQLIYLVEIEPFCSIEEFAKGKCAIEDIRKLGELRRNCSVLGGGLDEKSKQEGSEA